MLWTMQINEIRVFRVFRCSRTRQGINEAFVFASLGVLVGLNDKNVFISFFSRIYAFYQALAFQTICRRPFLFILYFFISEAVFFLLVFLHELPRIGHKFFFTRIATNEPLIFTT